MGNEQYYRWNDALMPTMTDLAHVNRRGSRSMRRLHNILPSCACASRLAGMS
jgi:hypothetical protein